MHVIHRRPAVFLFFSTPIMCASRGLDGFLPAEFRAVPAGRRDADASYHMARRRVLASPLRPGKVEAPEALNPAGVTGVGAWMLGTVGGGQTVQFCV
jgi:hypothetical protein